MRHPVRIRARVLFRAVTYSVMRRLRTGSGKFWDFGSGRSFGTCTITVVLVG